MQKSDLAKQFAQSFGILLEIVRGFDQDTWANGGCGYQSPARTAFHILLGAGYYVEHRLTAQDLFGDDWQNLPADQLPSQDDIRGIVNEIRPVVQSWIEALDLDGPNRAFPWAGSSNTGLLIFLLRHTMYHIGELNSLLYQSKDGQIEDLWMAGFKS